MTSIADQILDNMVAAIELIKTASGYQNDIASAAGGGGGVRWDEDGPELDDIPIAVVYGPSESKEQGPITKTNVEMTVFVDVYSRKPSSATSTDQYCKSLSSDIERAMMADRKRGNLAHDTQTLETNVLLTTDGSSILLVEVTFLVKFRHSDTNPEVA
jgi:hypothetical protein